jgi:glycosyltransferase involved in cell wall biosynthesis
LELVVHKEVPEHFKNKLYVLPNFYNDESSSFGVTAVARKWDKKPICYVGRMDSLKNTKELLEIFAKLIEKHDEYVLVLAGNVMPDYMDLDAQIHSHELIGKVNALGAIPFEDVRGLLACVKMSDGIFVSPSLGESFGLSVLEAMANEVPVVITDIECHKALVNNDDAFIYKQGNIDEAVSKILSIGSGANYEKAGKQVKAYSENFNIDSFMKSWNDLIGEICAKFPKH